MGEDRDRDNTIGIGRARSSVPVAVVPNAPRCPSWNIHTSAPKAAVNDKMLSVNDFTGNTTLPVSTNKSTNVIAAMIARTMGSREVTAWAVSLLLGALPVNSGCRPPGPGTACRPSSCLWEAGEYSGALLVTVRNALPSLSAVVADGGPTRAPATNVPAGEETDSTSATRESWAA